MTTETTEHQSHSMHQKDAIKHLLAHVWAYAGYPKFTYNYPLHVNGKDIPFTITPPEFFSNLLFLGVSYEQDVTAFINRSITRQNMNIYVIGADIGYHAVRAAELSPNGVVACFEPDNNSRKTLTHNMRNYPHAEIERNAISNVHNKKQMLTRFKRHSAFNTISPQARIVFKRNRLVAQKTQPVMTTTIDQYVRKIATPPDLMIIDVENGEMNVLQGAQQTLEIHKPIIIIEGGDMGRSEEISTRNTLLMLQDFGYNISEFHNTSGEIIHHNIADEYPRWINLLAEPLE